MSPALLLCVAALSLQRAAAAIGGDGAALTAPDDCWVAHAEAVHRIEQEQHVKAVEARSLDEWAAAARQCSSENRPFFTPSSFGALLDRFAAVSKDQLRATTYILRAAVRGGAATALAGDELSAAIDERLANQAAFVGRVQLPAGTQVIDFGDLHGQIGTFVDALTELRGRRLIDNSLQLVPGVALVLTGDYVDRGYKGAEVLALAMVLKIRNPHSAFLVRGNHEDVLLNPALPFLKGLARKIVGTHSPTHFLASSIPSPAGRKAIRNPLLRIASHRPLPTRK